VASAGPTTSDEALPGRVDGRQLQFFLRPEQGVDTALGHARDLGEPADGQAVEPFDRGEPGGLPGNAGPGPVAGCPGPPGRRIVLIGHWGARLLSGYPLDLRRTVV